MTISNYLGKRNLICAGRLLLVLAALLLLSGHPAQAQSTWTGATGGDWNTSGNWSAGVPTTTAVFSASSVGGTFTVANAVSVQTVTNLAFYEGVWTIGTTNGDALDLSAGGEILDQTPTLATSNTVYDDTINAPLVLEGTSTNYTFANNSSTNNSVLIFNGGITSAATSSTTDTLTLTGTIAKTNYNIINGIIGNGSAGGTLAIDFTSSSSSWTLAGQNTFSGGVTVSGTGYLSDTATGTISGGVLQSSGLGTGTLAWNASARLTGSTTNVVIDNPITISNSTFETQGNYTLGTNSLTTMPTITVSGASIIESLTDQITINDVIAGTSGTLSLEGAGGTTALALIITGSNTYNQLTTVTTQATEFENGTAWGGNAELEDATAGVIMVSGGITGGGTTTNSLTTHELYLNSATFATGGTGNLENVSGTNTYNGEVVLGKSTTISVDSGTLTLASPTFTMTVNGLTLTGPGTGIIEGSMTGTTNTASVTVTGTNSSLWILEGSNTYTGATTVTTGTLELNGSSLAGTAVTVSNNAILASSNSSTIGVSGGGSLTISNGGTLNLQGGGLGNQLALLNTTNTALTLGSGTTGTITLDFDVGSSADEIKLQNSSSAVSMTNVTVDVNINGLGGLTATNEDLIYAPGGGLETSTADYSLAVTGTTNGYTLVLDPTSTALILEVEGSATTPTVAYWTGASGSSWQTVGNFSTTNTSNTPATAVPGKVTDVVFSTSSPTATNLSTTLDAPTTVNSLTFNATSGAVTIAAGTNSGSLTLEATTTTSSNGINVAPNGINDQSGAGAVTISAPVALGTNQTWTNA
ncbi:MAG: hypothetical protein LV481_05810, partial [Methylacidiphilales bacterium]|nr:hypothetical protein [Candidatus Methylacidiphilales bacterium]